MTRFAPPFRHQAAQRLESQLIRMDGQGAPKTASCLHQLPSGAIGVSFELINASTGHRVTYNAAYALSAGVSDWFNPINGQGEADNSVWIPITRNGDPAITVPPADSPACPARVMTDVMAFPAAPPTRIDGGQGICLFFRQCPITHTGTVRVFDQSIPPWRGAVNGQHPGQFSQTLGGGWSAPGNHCTPGRFAIPRDPNSIGPFSVPNAVVPLLSCPVLGVMSVGDSILSGAASQEEVDMGVNGMGLWLTRMLNHPHRPALHVNEAVTGMSSENYTRNALLSLAHHTPDVMLLQTYSANDPGEPAVTEPAVTKAGAWRAFQRTMALAAKAAAAGTRVVLVTSPPFCGEGSDRHAREWEAVRLYANGLAMRSGMPYVDCDMVLGDGARPVGYRAGLSPDFVHPGDPGARLMAEEAARVLLTAYGLS